MRRPGVPAVEPPDGGVLGRHHPSSSSSPQVRRPGDEVGLTGVLIAVREHHALSVVVVLLLLLMHAIHAAAGDEDTHEDTLISQQTELKFSAP